MNIERMQKWYMFVGCLMTGRYLVYVSSHIQNTTILYFRLKQKLNYSFVWINKVKLRQKLIRNYSGKDDRDSFVLTSMEYSLLYIVLHRTVYLIALLDTRSF